MIAIGTIIDIGLHNLCLYGGIRYLFNIAMNPFDYSLFTPLVGCECILIPKPHHSKYPKKKIHCHG